MLYLILFISFFLSGISCRVIPPGYQLQQYKNNAAVKRLQEYIQLDTTLGKNSDEAVEFWKRQVEELGLPYKVHRPGCLPVFVATLVGRKPNLPTLLVNTHSDVVPVDENFWTHPGFSAYIDDKGDMYGRGTQDTKSVGIQYLEALRKIIQNNITLERTVHLMVVPDEETGSFKGLKPFVKTEAFKSLNIGFALDEGLTSEDDTLLPIYVDKIPWQMQIDLRGPSGHSSILQNGTALSQFEALLNMTTEFRMQQASIMRSKSVLDYGAYTSLNIDIVESGIAVNVIPSILSLVIDARLSIDEKIDDFEALVHSWLAQLGSNTTLEFIRREDSSPATSIDDSNIYWVTMRDTLKDLGLKLQPVVCPGTTDMLVLRKLGIPAIGFSTRTNMLNKLHDVDEYIPIHNFLQGIDIYVTLIKNLANLPGNSTSN